MATMYPLFFGILFTAVCSDLDAGRHTVSMRRALYDEYDQHTARARIVDIAARELGVREATGHNDGERVATYLNYTGLDSGHAWCAAFVSWCYGQAGLPAPRNPWSPALFPHAKTYCTGGDCHQPKVSMRMRPADIFGIYSHSAKRINHVGLVWDIAGKYLRTIEGNVENRVLSKRRHLSTVYALADWVSDGAKNQAQ